MSIKSRFDAERIERLATINDTGRVEVQFVDGNDQEHVVSVPVPAAVALARLICDVSEKAPFLLGPRVARAKRA